MKCSISSYNSILARKFFYVSILTISFLLILSLINESHAYSETSTILQFGKINQSLNSSKGINLDKIPTINDSKFSTIVDNNSGPVRESLVSDDRNYTQEKLLAENVTLPKNVIEVKPPSNLSKVNVSNFFISQNNISTIIGGLSANDSCMISTNGKDGNQTLNMCNPPDIQIAPGNHQVIEMTNNLIGVWNKNTLLSNKSIPEELDKNHLIYWTNDFFGINKANDTYDPSLIYDPISQRWFASIIEFEIPEESKPMKLDKMGVVLAFSSNDSSPDNYKNWTVMKFSPRLIVGQKDYYFCPDRPMIYGSSDKVIISMTVSLQPDGFCEPENKSSRFLFLAVFNKSDLFNVTLPRKDFKVLYLQGNSYHYVPVKSALNGTEINLVNIPPYNKNNSRLSLINIDGPLQNLTCKFYDRELDYPKLLPPNAAQKGTNSVLYLADNRALDAVSNKNNETWVTFQTGCNTDYHPNNTSCLRLVKFNVNKNSLYRDCESIPFSNSTSPYYLGGNASVINSLTSSNISKTISEHKLPANASNKILAKLISDEHIAPEVINEINSTLNESFSNLTTSEISDKIANRELPPTISNDILSNLTLDKNKKIAQEVIIKTQSVLNATVSNLNSSELSKAISEHELPLNASNKILANLTSDAGLKEKVESGLNTSVSNLNSSEIKEVVSNHELAPTIANDILSNLTLDKNKKIAQEVINETRPVLRSDFMISDVLDFPIGSGDHYYYYPSIAIAKNGNLVVYFGFSSINEFPSLGLVVINTSNASQTGNTINKTPNFKQFLIKNGTHFAQEEKIINDYCPETNPCTRYGDYFSINNDPYNSTQLWAAGEYYDGKHFSTVINNIRVD